MDPLHREIYKLLCEIDDICREHGIVYYLHAGSVIGAFRHGGIIPWDDDADIMMTPENYRKFKEAFAAKERPQRALVDFENYDQSVFLYGQYKDTSTAVLPRSGLMPDYPNGLFVDILIMDPVSEEPKAIKRHVDNLQMAAEVACDYYVISPTVNQKKFRKYHFLRKIVGREWLVRHLVKRLERGQKRPYDGYIQRMALYPSFWDKKFLGEPEYVQFGPRKFPVPSHPYEYLRYTYGDSWMNYPDDKSTHGFLYSTSIPFTTLQQEYKADVNKEKYLDGWKRYKHWQLLKYTWGKRVRVCNSKRIAAAHALAVRKEISDKELLELYNNGQYSEVMKRVQFYLDNQLKPRFTKDNIPFHVSDTVFLVSCMTLILRGQYDIAQKLVRCNQSIRVEYPSFDQVEQAIEATRELSIAYYEGGRVWTVIAALAKQGMKCYPHHADFVAAHCDALAHTAEDPLQAAEVIRDLCTRELRFHPGQSHLLKHLADAQMTLGKKKKAVANYQKAFRLTNNGMLCKEIRAIAENYSFEVEEAPPRKKNDWYYLQVQQAQSKIQTMLQELDCICKQENIPYFLGGYLAAEAVELGTFAPECCSAYIVMRPSDRKRFLEAVERNLGANRALECFENSRNYPDFSMRYCDTATTLFDLKTEGFYKHHALNIAVYFLRDSAQGRCPEWVKVGLQAAVEACAFPSIRHNHGYKRRLAGMAGRVYFALLGKKLGKKLAWKLIYHPQSTEWRIKGSIKSYWYKEIKLPMVDFRRHSICRLNCHEFPVPVNYREYNAPQVAKNWNNGKPVGMRLVGEAVAEMNVPCAQFKQELDRLNLKRKHFWAWRRLDDCNRASEKECSYSWGTWRLATCALDRYNLWERFMPQKKRILALRNAGNYRALESLLKPYLDKLVYYAKFKLPLAFDNDIFRVAWEVLERKGKGTVITSVLPKMAQRQFQPIKIRIPAKMTMGAMAMKKAIHEEKQMILDYLGQDVANCLYLYADVAMYGVDSENMKVWYDTDEEGIRMVVMKYHTSFQVYSNRDFENVDGLLYLIEQEKPIGVSAREEIIRAVEDKVSDRYRVEYGIVYQGKPISRENLEEQLQSCDVCIEQAKPEDAPGIARLLFMDAEMACLYTEESLAKELRDRIETGMGRSYIIRDGDQIVAHNATYAESDKFVVIGGLMVHPDYRDTDYAYWMDLKSSLEFQSEGKERYFMALDKKIIRWHKFLKTPIATHYGRFSLIEKPKD